LQTDNKKLELVGDIDYKFINKLIKQQKYKCYQCNDKLVTFLYVPYCCYKFSIDRIDNNKPHNKDNVKISCYFCNCKDHFLYDKKEKLKCNNVRDFMVMATLKC
jgi:hypothetical protein